MPKQSLPHRLYAAAGAQQEEIIMLRVTLTVKCGDTYTLELPGSVAEILKSPAPYFLAYGSAAVQFGTSDTSLNEQLERKLQDAVEGGILQLNLLANILDQMDDERLALLRDNLPDAPCGW